MQLPWKINYLLVLTHTICVFFGVAEDSFCTVPWKVFTLTAAFSLDNSHRLLVYFVEGKRLQSSCEVEEKTLYSFLISFANKHMISVACI